MDWIRNYAEVGSKDANIFFASTILFYLFVCSCPVVKLSVSSISIRIPKMKQNILQIVTGRVMPFDFVFETTESVKVEVLMNL